MPISSLFEEVSWSESREVSKARGV